MSDETAAGTSAPQEGEPLPEGAPEAGLEQQPQRELPSNEATNLVRYFTPEEQKALADQCLRDHAADIRSRESRMKRWRKWYGLYASIMRAKSHPMNNAANINLPTLAFPVLMTAGRLWDMLYPASGHLFYSIPSNPEDYERAASVELFVNHYVRTRMSGWGSGLRPTVFQTVLFGTGVRRTFWDVARSCVVSEPIPLHDFVVDANVKSYDPNLRDCGRYAFIDHPSWYQIQERGRAGEFENYEKIKADDAATGTLAAQDAKSGKEEDDKRDQRRLVIEQHRKWTMPNLGAYPFDGQSHPCMVTIDAASQTVLRFVVREQDDSTDLSRFEREKAELAAFESKLQAFEQAMAAFQAVQAPPAAAPGAEMAPGGPTPAPMAPSAPQMPPPVPPVPPAWYTGAPPTPPKKVESLFFTVYRLFESEDFGEEGQSFYGIGLGDLLGASAEANNTIINQFLNALALKNQRPGVIARTAKMQRGAITFNPGELVEVDDLNGDINKVIQFLDIPEGDRATIPVVNMIGAAVKELAGISNMMSGEGVGANRTAKEAMILAEQSLKQMSIAQRGLAESLLAELKLIVSRLALFLSDEEIADVVSVEGVPQRIKIGRGMFREDAHLACAADPRTKIERQEEAQRLYGFAMQNPMFQNPVLMRKVTEEVLRALGASHLIPMLPEPPKPPPPPPPRPYWDEDADFLRGKDSQPNPADNDDEHLAGHMGFEKSPAGQRLDQQGRDMLERHIRWHEAQRHQKLAQQHEQQFAPQGAMNGIQPADPMAGGPGAGPGPMAVPPGNAGVPGLPPPS